MKLIKINRDLKIVILTFIIAFLVTQLPFPAQFNAEAQIMVAIALIAAVFWVTECIPIPVTALLLILLQGLFRIQPFSEALAYIAHPVNSILLAGFIIAGSLKKYGLDRRIGLKFISVVGNKTTHIILGVMTATAFLSMWISNTAAAAVMIPIGVSVIRKWDEKPAGSNLGKAMVIGIAFAANIGGMGTPLGTPPVPITIAFLDELAGIQISFLDWIIRAIPLVILLIPITWKMVTWMYKPEVERIKGSMNDVKKELAGMGGLNRDQKHVILLFIIAVGLWLLDAFGFWLPVPGNWLYLASLIIALMYVFPGIGVLNWREASKEIDWGILILIGGGLALGSGLEKTGVIGIIAGYMETALVHSSLFVVVAVLAFITAFSITFFSSLTATSSTFVPVAIALAISLGISPLLLALVAGMAACFAFLLPVNTPPNAIAYSTDFFHTLDMAKLGIVLTVICVLILVSMAMFYWVPLL